MLTQRYPQSVRHFLPECLLLLGFLLSQDVAVAVADTGSGVTDTIEFDNGFSLKAHAVPGGVALVDLNSGNTSSTAQPDVFWQEKKITTLARENRWFALVGLPLDITPGTYWLSVINTDIDSDSPERQISFIVEAHEYPLQKLQIADETRVTPPASLATRLQVERRQILNARSAWRDDFDAANFQLPVDGRISSIFGLRRLFNNSRRSRHRGLDIAVPTGVPVFASHAGIVNEVGDFHFNGKTVFVDHGRGLVGLYSHLSKILVRPGEYVIAGQTVGLVGATGRVTGPHLHWGMALNGTWVDPALFIVD